MTRLGKYELHEQLGKGGFGTVYRATDPIGRTVAAKVLRPGWSDDPDTVDRFRKEALAAGSLFHSHIATILDFGDEDGRLFVIMRYVDGVSLDKLLTQQGRIPFEKAVAIANQVGDALDYAHNNGFLHRDVKPANILISEKEGAVLTDFGLVRAMQSSGLSMTSILMGTPNYIAPEIWSGQAATPAADVYSLACVFYEMLTGRLLFTGDSPVAIMSRHVTNGPEFPAAWPEDVPPAITQVLSKALAQDPAQRYLSASQFTAAIEAISKTPASATAAPHSVPTAPIAHPTGIQGHGEADEPTRIPTPVKPPTGPIRTEVQPSLVATAATAATMQPVRQPQQQDQVPPKKQGMGLVTILGLGAAVVFFLLFVIFLLFRPVNGTQQPVVVYPTLVADNAAVLLPAPSNTSAPPPAPSATTVLMKRPTATTARSQLAVTSTAYVQPKTPIPPGGPKTCWRTTAIRAHFRYGPGENYSMIRYLDTGEQLELDGRNKDGSWVRGIFMDNTIGWLAVSELSEDIDLCGLSELEIPPTATPTRILYTETLAPPKRDKPSSNYP